MTTPPKPRAATVTAQTARFAPIGQTGLRQYGGFLAEEFLPDLAGPRGSRVYREMSDNDDTVGAVIFAISSLITQCKWTVQAVDDTPEAEEAKEFVEQVMLDMAFPWQSVIAEACSMFVYGFAPMEMVWKRRAGRTDDPLTSSAYDDGQIGVAHLGLRAQPTVARWQINDATGIIEGMWQQPWSAPQVFIPAHKLLLFRTTTARNNPEGRSILRTAYRSYFFKKKIEDIEAVGVERDLAGLPVAYIPARFFDRAADAGDKAVLASWQALVTSIRRDQKEGVVLPSDRDSSGNLLFELRLLSTAGSRSFDTTKIIDRYNRGIATSVLADFIFLGQQAVGSFALSSNKTALFATAMGSFTTAIADEVNLNLITKLWAYNARDPQFKPKLVCGDIEQQNLAELGEFLTAMTGAGAQMFPDRELENHLRGVAGLPLAPEEGEGEADPMAGAGGDDGDDDAGLETRGGTGA